MNCLKERKSDDNSDTVWKSFSSVLHTIYKVVAAAEKGGRQVLVLYLSTYLPFLYKIFSLLKISFHASAQWLENSQEAKRSEMNIIGAVWDDDASCVAQKMTLRELLKSGRKIVLVNG